MGFITQEGLQNLKQYKYVSGGRTFFDNVFNPWWEYVTTLMPMVYDQKLIDLVEYGA